jgi:hypothetical protein
VDAIHWADLDTGGVLRSDAWFSDDVCHRFSLKPPCAAGVRILARQRPTGMTEPEVPKGVDFGVNLQYSRVVMKKPAGPALAGPAGIVRSSRFTCSSSSRSS